MLLRRSRARTTASAEVEASPVKTRRRRRRRRRRCVVERTRLTRVRVCVRACVCTRNQAPHAESTCSRPDAAGSLPAHPTRDDAPMFVLSEGASRFTSERVCAYEIVPSQVFPPTSAVFLLSPFFSVLFFFFSFPFSFFLSPYRTSRGCAAFALTCKYTAARSTWSG